GGIGAGAGGAVGGVFDRARTRRGTSRRFPTAVAAKAGNVFLLAGDRAVTCADGVAISEKVPHERIGTLFVFGAGAAGIRHQSHERGDHRNGSKRRNSLLPETRRAGDNAGTG